MSQFAFLQIFSKLKPINNYSCFSTRSRAYHQFKFNAMPQLNFDENDDADFVL